MIGNMKLVEELNRIMGELLEGVPDSLGTYMSQEFQGKLRGVIALHIPKRSRLKDPAEPKRPKSAYILFTQTAREELKGEKFERGGLFARLGEMWRELSTKERQSYAQRAEEDKQRYEEEKASYVRPPDEILAELDVNKPKEKKGKGKRPKKPAGAPTGPRSAYILFSITEREFVKEDGFEGPGIFSELGRRWKLLTDEQKQKWEAEAEADKKRYEAESKTLKTSEQPESKTLKSSEQPESKTLKTSEQPESKTLKTSEQPESKTLKISEQPKTLKISEQPNKTPENRFRPKPVPPKNSVKIPSDRELFDD